MAKLGQNPVLRTIALFVPLFLSAAGYGVFRWYTEDYENAVWAGVGAALSYVLVAYFAGWNFSTATAAAFTFIVVGNYDLDATPATLAVWAMGALVIAHTGATRARLSIVDDKVVRDESVGFTERFVFEFLIYCSFFATTFVAIKMPHHLYYPAGILLVVAFGLFTWWAFVAGAQKDKASGSLTRGKRKRRGH